jgi:excisionase family DNA binding protein
VSDKPFVPIEELAKHFTVSVSTIRAWVRQGFIPKSTYVKVGNTYRFSVDAVSDALMAEEEPKTETNQVVVEPVTQEHALRIVQSVDDHFAADAVASVDDDL